MHKRALTKGIFALSFPLAAMMGTAQAAAPEMTAEEMERASAIYFQRCAGYMKPGAFFGFQAILRNRVPRNRKDLEDLAFTADIIFPGGLNPRLEELVAAVNPYFEILELRTVHDLLHRPEQMADEQSLESILASLAASLEVLNELLGCLPRGGRDSSVFVNSVRHIHLRAVGICSDCIPHEYAPDLADWMDRVQTLAEELE